MGGYSNFYGGADYGLDSKYDESLGMEYKTPPSSISLATNPFTANQIQDVTTKLNTGAKALEINMAFVDPQHGSPAESIPNQHLEELNRLRKLLGVDFTVHGPLIEPTGFARQDWDESQRQQAERQMWLGLERARKVDPDGNVVVTFHSSNGLPEPETVVIDADTGQEKTTDIVVVDERSGKLSRISPKANPMLGEETPLPAEEIKKINKEVWVQQLNRLSYAAHEGGTRIKQLMDEDTADKEKPADIKSFSDKEIYLKSKTEDGQQWLNKLSPDEKKYTERVIHLFNNGEINTKEAYNDLQNLFNQAWYAVEKDKNEEDRRKLEKFSKEIQSKKNDLDDPIKLSDIVLKGVDVLNTIKNPQIVRPLKEFAIDKASDTFSNLALKSYNEFKDKAPIISIENPPAGSGLSRADDLRLLIEATRKKFVDKAKKEGMSKYEAEEQAKKLIGVTWDVGHINMIKKFGFDDKALVEETKKIAPFVKNVHLSDNFGMEHTELPMGMGNVPMKAHEEALRKQFGEKLDKIKKVIETGNWYQHFKTPPFAETLAAFGSPIYAMQLTPSWNQIYGRTGAGYFGGYGMNPDVHHSIYGAGFSSLPVELGGQITGRSRFSGTAME